MARSSLLRPRRAAPAAFAACAALAAVAVGRPAWAVDPFEIQVYDGTANGPGVPGLELHVNHVANGLRDVEPPALAPNHQTHFTLEPSYGVTPFWEIGAYFQTALRADGTFDYAGVKLRSKFVTPPGWHPHMRLGANFELSVLPERYEPDRLGAEIRPIVAWESDHLLVAANPIVGVSFRGQGWRDGPSFEPAIKVLAKLPDVVGVGLEYYAGLGPIADPSPLREQEHYVYEVVDLLSVDDLELSGGVGEGLSTGSNRLVFKVIVGYSFDRAVKPSPSAARRVPRFARR